METKEIPTFLRRGDRMSFESAFSRWCNQTPCESVLKDAGGLSSRSRAPSIRASPGSNVRAPSEMVNLGRENDQFPGKGVSARLQQKFRYRGGNPAFKLNTVPPPKWPAETMPYS
jgi:hypothetical protein